MKKIYLDTVILESMAKGILIDLSMNTLLKEKYINILKKAQDKNGFIHPKVGRSSANDVTYSQPAILKIPHDGFSKAVQPIDNEHILATVHIDVSDAWVLMNMLNISKFKGMAQNNKDLYAEIYRDAFGIKGTVQEIRELKMAWAVLCDGGAKSALNKNNLQIDTQTVNNYFKDQYEIKKWKRDCNNMASNHVHFITTPFGTKLFANCKQPGYLRKQLMYLSVQGTGVDVLAFSIEHYMQELKRMGLEKDISIYYIIKNDIVLNISNTLIVNNGIEKVKSDLISMFSCSLPQGWIPPRIDVTI